MKKSALALILAVLMAVGLLTIGAAADEPDGSLNNPFTTVKEYNDAVEGSTWDGEDIYLTITGENFTESNPFNLTNVQSRENPPKLHLTITKCTFTGNTAKDTNNPSFMYLSNCQELNINACEFNAGDAGLKYGINWNLIQIEDAVVTITSCTFDGEYAENAIKLNQRGGTDDAATDIYHGEGAFPASIASATISDVEINSTVPVILLGSAGKGSSGAAAPSTGAFPVTISNCKGSDGKDVNVFLAYNASKTDADTIEEAMKAIAAGNPASEEALALAAKLVVPVDDTTTVSKTANGDFAENGDFVASIGSDKFTSLGNAIAAVGNGQTITLLKELNSVNETFTITKDITITGAKMTVERTVAGVAFEIRNGGVLTFEKMTLEINGVIGSSGKDGDAVTKGIDVYDGELFIIDSDVDFNNLRSAIVMQKAESRANIVSSMVTASNVWGNFSNGGNWHIIGSSLNISGNEDSKGHGLSATELEIWDSSVNINFCGLLGLTAKQLDVDNSTVTVNECGSQLPYTSEWSTDKESYKYPVEIKNGGSVTIDEDSWVTLMNNPTGNVLYLVNSTLAADGRLDASIRTSSGSECYIVSIEGFNPMVVASGNTIKLPTVTKPGYIFMGWKCSDGYTHQPGEVIEVTKNMTFTAIWANMPDITPGTPDDDNEPVVPEFPFTDVYVGQWFYEAVKYVYDKGIMNGMDRYTFEPSPTAR